MKYITYRSIGFAAVTLMVSVSALFGAMSPVYAYISDGSGTGCTDCGSSSGGSSSGGSSSGGSSSGSGSAAPTPRNPSCTISANPNSVQSGGSSTLTWNSSNATSATLTSVGSVSVNGSHVFSNLTGTKTYTLTVTGSGGTRTCTATVNVTPIEHPQPTCSIYANPSSVQSGGSSTLTWSSSNATSANLTEAGSVSTNGSYTFSNITYTKTYTLTVTGQGGSNTCSTTVNVNTVNQQPTCSIYANPSTVASGGSSTLTWNSSNATSASLTDAGSVSTNGSYTSYNITGNRTYVLTVWGNGGSNTCSTTVYVNTVNQQPTCSIYADPSSVSYGGSSTMHWTSSNATSASLSEAGSVSTNGSYTFNNITGTKTYSLTVWGNGGSNTCQTTVNTNSNNNQPSCSLSINPAYYADNNYNNGNNQATISWNTYNANSATIDHGVGSVNTGNGSRVIYASNGNTYTMTVWGTNGQSSTCTANWNYQPTQNLWCSISAQPQHVSNGGSAVLTWTSGGASSAWLSDNQGNVATNGSKTVYPGTGSKTYTLTISNGSQTQTCSTHVGSNNYAAAAAYVSLTQVPYTGLDLDLMGMLMYWLALAGAGFAAIYALVFYRGGIFSLASSFLRSHNG